jgi:hypothetical protein
VCVLSLCPYAQEQSHLQYRRRPTMSCKWLAKYETHLYDNITAFGFKDRPIVSYKQSLQSVRTEAIKSRTPFSIVLSSCRFSAARLESSQNMTFQFSTCKYFHQLLFLSHYNTLFLFIPDELPEDYGVDIICKIITLYLVKITNIIIYCYFSYYF